MRLRKGLTQLQLATVIGMDPAQLSKWERGELQRPAPEVARLIARALDIPLHQMGLAVIGVSPLAHEAEEKAWQALAFPPELTAEEWQAIVQYARYLRLDRERAPR